MEKGYRDRTRNLDDLETLRGDATGTSRKPDTGSGGTRRGAVDSRLGEPYTPDRPQSYPSSPETEQCSSCPQPRRTDCPVGKGSTADCRDSTCGSECSRSTASCTWAAATGAETPSCRRSDRPVPQWAYVLCRSSGRPASSFRLTEREGKGTGGRGADGRFGAIGVMLSRSCRVGSKIGGAWGLGSTW